jgi:hypothetical protein
MSNVLVRKLSCRNVECRVLARAINHHLQDRVLVSGVGLHSPSASDANSPTQLNEE